MSEKEVCGKCGEEFVNGCDGVCDNCLEEDEGEKMSDTKALEKLTTKFIKDSHDKDECQFCWGGPTFHTSDCLQKQAAAELEELDMKLDAAGVIVLAFQRQNIQLRLQLAQAQEAVVQGKKHVKNLLKLVKTQSRGFTEEAPHWDWCDAAAWLSAHPEVTK